MSGTPLPTPRGSPAGPRPSWGLCGLLAAQHVLVLASLLCLSHLPLLGEAPGGPGPRPPAQLLASSLFSCGLATLLQAWVGSRLPLVQAPTFEFLIPALVLTAVRPPADPPQLLNNGSQVPVLTHESLQEVSGAVLVSGLLRVTAGLLSGPAGLLARCGPLVVAPTLVVAGLTAHREAARLCAQHWGLAMGLIFLMVVCSQHLASRSVPACPWSPAPRPSLPVFRLFSVLVPVVCVWSFSALLGLGRPPPSHLTGPAPAPWLWFPHPGERGRPALTPRAVAAGTAMALASSASSLACYALAGQVLRLPALPSDACSRGLVTEGLGSLLAGGLGGLGGSAASFANVGAIGLTQVGWRREVQLSGLLCVALGLSPRLAQALVALPLPLHGAVLWVSQAPVLSGGLARFRAAHLHSGRNVFLLGLAVFMALLLPRRFTPDDAPTALQTGWPPLDVLLQSLLATPVLLAALLAFVLDNTVPGTREERGLPPLLSPPCPPGHEAQAPQATAASALLRGPADEADQADQADPANQADPADQADPANQADPINQANHANEADEANRASQLSGLPRPLRALWPLLPGPFRRLCPPPSNSGAKGQDRPQPGEAVELLPVPGGPGAV
ncbi:solute carrier family 23 member 3 [Tachyglossus aculeatus]|uniref:solute carrier family 23 member 3 n=1 Tax=Tachyglossus aculeatus TaxID=9261 RepID=UPI0018F799A9|nr:solute carrier family 23 member 3 [Tachyglossus aculeatus]